MPLTSKGKQQLKAKAHALKPVILIGQHGLTEAVKKEIDRALNDHELIKIRIQTTDRELKCAIFAEICVALNAEQVQMIGNVGVVYRRNVEK